MLPDLVSPVQRYKKSCCIIHGIGIEGDVSIGDVSKMLWFHVEDFYMVVVVVLLLYVHGKHLRSCRDGQLT